METVKRCRVTIKVMYETAKEARNAIKLFNDRNEGKIGVKKLKSLYLCEHCKSYHVSSMSNYDKRSYELHLKNQNNKKVEPKKVDDYISSRLEALKSKNKVK